MSEKVSKVVEGWKGPGRRDGMIEPLKLSDDGLHMEPGQRDMYEWWYFDAHLDTGHTLVVFFHAANPNPGLEGKIGVEILLLRPDGRRIQRFVPHDKSEFRAARDRPEVQIGRNTIRVEERDDGLPVYEIRVQEGGLGCHLRYTAEVDGWKPGSGLSRFGGMGFFGWVVPFARASVEGSITDGDTTLPVSGIGYHDHNWLNFRFQSIIDYWMWGRIYSKNFTVAFAYIQCNRRVDNHTVKVLMMAKGRQVVLSTGEFDLLREDLEYNPKAKHRYPKRIILSAPGELKATLQVRKVLEAQDLLETFNPLLRVLARHILRIRPGYFRLLSEFELEAPLGERITKETGTTLHELVLFQPLD
ncbi:MAG: hypothetical protein ABSG98_10515 [Anaerolineales bacterium]